MDYNKILETEEPEEPVSGEEITEEISQEERNFDLVLDILCVHSDKDLREELYD